MPASGGRRRRQGPPRGTLLGRGTYRSVYAGVEGGGVIKTTEGSNRKGDYKNGDSKADVRGGGGSLSRYDRELLLMWLLRGSPSVVSASAVVCPWDGTFTQEGGGAMLDGLVRDGGREVELGWMLGMAEGVESVHGIGAAHTDINLSQFLVEDGGGVKLQVREGLYVSPSPPTP